MPQKQSSLPVRQASKQPPLQQIMQEPGKLPPQAVDLEEVVLGAIMLEKNALAEVIDILKPEYFYKPANEKIYTAIRNIYMRPDPEPVDSITVTMELKRIGELEAVGGPYYITRLCNAVASSENIVRHSYIILEKYLLRELIRTSSDIVSQAFSDTEDVFEMLDKAEANIFAIAEQNIRRNPDKIDKLIDDLKKQIEKARTHEDNLTGVPCGFSNLDRITSGWQPSDLIILASRPSMGKTSFMLSIARNAAVEFKKPVAVFSLEMTAMQLVLRLAAIESEIPAERLRKGRLENYEWEQFHSQVSKLMTSPIFIDDSHSLSILELRAKARRLKAKNNIELIMIDYLQLMTSGLEGKSNREQEISRISRALKSIAKELNIPIIALSQMSRKVEERSKEKHRPMLSDLRESGAIEQDADIVMFIYRPEYYKLNEWDDDGTDCRGQAEILIEKHRNGRTGKERLRFISELTRFTDLDYKGYFQAEPGSEEPAVITVQSRINDEPNDEPA